MSKAMELKKLIEAKELLVLPGCHDVMSALIAEEEGFKTVFFNDCGLAAHSYGLPDIGLLNCTDMVPMLRRITSAVDIPVMADGANGFGEPLNAYYTVQQYIDAGAASINIDDQACPKRCGHQRGKKIEPMGKMIAKLEAAMDASKNHDFLIIARTDAMGVPGAGIEEAIKRGNAYAKKGASLIFVDAPSSIEEIKRVVNEIDAPVLINQVEGGSTPLLTHEELEKIGAAVVQHGAPTFLVPIKAYKNFYSILKQKGTLRYDMDITETLPQLNERVNLKKWATLDQRYRDIEKEYKD